MLRAVQKIFEEEEGGRIKEVKRVCKEEDLTILKNLLPHITSLMDRAVKQEASVRVVTHGDFHQWNLAFGGKPHPLFGPSDHLNLVQVETKV